MGPKNEWNWYKHRLFFYEYINGITLVMPEISD